MQWNEKMVNKIIRHWGWKTANFWGKRMHFVVERNMPKLSVTHRLIFRFVQLWTLCNCSFDDYLFLKTMGRVHKWRHISWSQHATAGIIVIEHLMWILWLGLRCETVITVVVAVRRDVFRLEKVFILLTEPAPNCTLCILFVLFILTVLLFWHGAISVIREYCQLSHISFLSSNVTFLHLIYSTLVSCNNPECLKMKW